MNAVMALFDSELAEEIFLLMKFFEIENYTRFKELHGSGKQGKKEGSITWPGTNEVIMMIMSDDELERFKQVAEDYKVNKGKNPGFIFFFWPLGGVIA